MSVTELFEQALDLPETERVNLVTQLLDSITELEDPGLESLMREAHNREKELEQDPSLDLDEAEFMKGIRLGQ